MHSLLGQIICRRILRSKLRQRTPLPLIYCYSRTFAAGCPEFWIVSLISGKAWNTANLNVKYFINDVPTINTFQNLNQFFFNENLLMRIWIIFWNQTSCHSTVEANNKWYTIGSHTNIIHECYNTWNTYQFFTWETIRLQFMPSLQRTKQ